MSLRDTAARAFNEGPEALNKLVNDPMARHVLTAYVVARGGPYASWQDSDDANEAAGSPTHVWLKTIEAARVNDVRGADRLAWAAYQAGDMKAAQRWVQRARADSPVTQWIMAKLMLRDGKLDKAESALRKAVALRPTEPKYHNNLGLIYGHQKRFEDAWNEFRKAAGEADAFYNLAFVKSSLNDFEGAKAEFRRALAVDPAHERASRALRAFELAETDLFLRVFWISTGGDSPANQICRLFPQSGYHENPWLPSSRNSTSRITRRSSSFMRLRASSRNSRACLLSLSTIT